MIWFRILLLKIPVNPWVAWTFYQWGLEGTIVFSFFLHWMRYGLYQFCCILSRGASWFVVGWLFRFLLWGLLWLRCTIIGSSWWWYFLLRYRLCGIYCERCLLHCSWVLIWLLQMVLVVWVFWFLLLPFSGLFHYLFCPGVLMVFFHFLYWILLLAGWGKGVKGRFLDTG